MSSKPKIKAFLSKLSRGRPLRDGEPLWDSGAIDSLGLLQLIHFLEAEFSVKIPQKEINLTTFQCINSISAYIEKAR